MSLATLSRKMILRATRIDYGLLRFGVADRSGRGIAAGPLQSAMAVVQLK